LKINKQGVFMPNLIPMESKDWIVVRQIVKLILKKGEQPPFVVHNEKIKKMLAYNKISAESILSKCDIFVTPDADSQDGYIAGITYSATGYFSKSNIRGVLSNLDAKVFLGEGSYGVVQVVEWQDGSASALKIQDLEVKNDTKYNSEIRAKLYNKEVEILDKLCYLKQAFIDNQAIFVPNQENDELILINKPSYIIKELHPGYSLESYFATTNNLSRMNAIRKCKLALQTAIAVQKLHKQNIVHGDIKPGNLMVNYKDDSFMVAAIDFGTSFVIEDNADSFAKLDAPVTQLYAAPETSDKSQLIISKESDIFALGKIFSHDFELNLIKAEPMLDVLIKRMTIDPRESRCINIDNVVYILEACIVNLEEKVEETKADKIKETQHAFK